MEASKHEPSGRAHFMSKGGGKGSGGQGGGGKGATGSGRPINGPSTTGNKSGDGRGNNPPAK